MKQEEYAHKVWIHIYNDIKYTQVLDKTLGLPDMWLFQNTQDNYNTYNL